MGAVSSVRPTLCVTRHAALGFCFSDVAAPTLAGLRVGECVSVTYVATSDADHYRFRAVRPATPPPGSTDCQAGS
jgi:hypothetical protein